MSHVVKKCPTMVCQQHGCHVTVRPSMGGPVPNLLWTRATGTTMEVPGVDLGPQPYPQKGVLVGGRTLAGTQPSFHKRKVDGWTGLRPFLALSGVLP